MLSGLRSSWYWKQTGSKILKCPRRLTILPFLSVKPFSSSLPSHCLRNIYSYYSRIMLGNDRSRPSGFCKWLLPCSPPWRCVNFPYCLLQRCCILRRVAFNKRVRYVRLGCFLEVVARSYLQRLKLFVPWSVWCGFSATAPRLYKKLQDHV